MRELFEAIEAGDVPQVRALLAADSSLVNSTDGQGSSPLHIAIRRRHVEIARLLIEHGADVNATTRKGSTPLALALGGIDPANDPLEFVSVLLANGADINIQGSQGRTPLEVAMVRYKSVELLKMLIRYGADVNAGVERDGGPGWLLCCAAQKGIPEIVSLLLESGAKVDVLIRGRTPLHCALGTASIKLYEGFWTQGERARA
jgi:ankyrin repeat protein